MDQEDFDIEMDRKSKGKFNRYVDMENHRHKPYGHRKKDILFFVYLISILLWGFLIAYLQPEIGIYGWVILAIPLLVFIISTLSLDSTSRAVEENFEQSQFLNAGLLLVLPLLACITKDFKGDHNLMVQIIFFAITFSLVSMIDVFVQFKWLTITNHVKSIFQTIALTLILFSLYLYYANNGGVPWVIKPGENPLPVF